MVHLTIVDGMLKTSFKELKDELEKLMGHELSQLKVDCNSNLSGYIGVSSHGRYTEDDILGIIARHAVYFKIEAEEDDYDSSYLFSDFIWDGKRMVQLYKNSWGSVREIEDWTWVVED